MCFHQGVTAVLCVVAPVVDAVGPVLELENDGEVKPVKPRVSNVGLLFPDVTNHECVGTGDSCRMVTSTASWSMTWLTPIRRSTFWFSWWWQK